MVQFDVRPLLAFFSAILFLFLIELVCPTAGLAQGAVNYTGNGGRHTIQGHIFMAGGRTDVSGLKIKLISLGNGDLFLYADNTGNFTFKNISPGSYTVIIDDNEQFENVRESVYIDDPGSSSIGGSIPSTSTARIMSVQIYLRPKNTLRTDREPGVVSAKLAQVPKEALKHYEKGLDLVQTDRAKDALAEFKQAVAIYPSLSVAYLEMGKIYLKTGRMDDAAAALSTAIKYEPNDFDTTLDYAIALYGKQDFDAAEPQFNKAAQLNASAVTPHYYLGLLFIQTKKLDKAQAELEAAKKLKGDKNFPLLHRYLGGVYVARNLNKQAVAELETYLKLAPNTKDADRIRQTVADLKSKLN